MGRSADGTMEAFHNRNSHDFTYTHGRGQLIEAVVNDSAGAILHKQHIGNVVLGSEEHSVTRALIVLAALNGSANNRLGLSIIGRVLRNGHQLLNRVYVIIGPDRTDVGFVDLVIRRRRTAIANEESASQFLVKHHAHLALQPANDIEIGNINDIVTIELLLLVDGRRIGRALKHSNHFVYLNITLNVTLSAGFVSRNISIGALDSAERSMVDTIHNNVHPAHIPLVEFGLSGKRLIVGEQHFDIVDAMLEERFLQTTISLAIFNDFCHIGVGQSVFAIVVFKHIVAHIVISLFFIKFTSSLFNSNADQNLHRFPLFISHAINSVFNGHACHFVTSI